MTLAQTVPGAGRPASAPLRALEAVLAAERERWLLWLPVALGAGIAAYLALDFEPSPLPAFSAAILLLELAVGVRARAGAAWICLLAAFAAAGFGLAARRAAEVAAPVVLEEVRAVRLSGLVAEVDPQEGGARLVLEGLSVERLAPEATPARVRLRVPAMPDGLRPGMRVEIRATLLPPPAPAEPGAYDFQRQAWFQRLGAVGFVLGPVRVLEERAAEASFAERLGRLRLTVYQRIAAALPDPADAVAGALLTGLRGAIPEENLQDMRDSGLAHLLAISGLHIGLVAGIVFFAVRAALALWPWLALRAPIKKWAALAALAASGGYLLLAGAPVSAQRAFVMVGLVLVAVLVDRTAISMRPVAIAAAIVLVLTPESVIGPSFQMSFGAVVALVAGYEYLRERAHPLGRVAGLRRPLMYLGGVAVSSVLATLATAPFAAYHFHRLATYGIAANLVAVPLTAFWIMPWGLLAMALMPRGLEELALVPMGWGIDGVLWAARLSASQPGAVLGVPAMPTAAMALMAVGGLWLCLWRRTWRLAGLLPFAVGFALAWAAERPVVLVDAEGRVFGVAASDGGRMLSTRRAGRFVSDRWQERDGLGKAAPWPAPGEASADGRLRCDHLGCVLRQEGGASVSLVTDPRAFAEDCAMAGAVVALMPAPGNCRPPVLIDRFDLWRDGAHALWRDGTGLRVESVNGWRGARPWVPRRGGDQ